MKLQRTFLLLMTALTAGCFQYVEADLAEVPLAKRVRLRLTDEEAARVLSYINPVDRTISGDLMARDGGTALLFLRSSSSFQEVEIPLSSVIETQVRNADPVKSIGLSFALVGAIGYAAWKGFSGGGPDRGVLGPFPDETVIPLFSFGLPLPFGR